MNGNVGGSSGCHGFGALPEAVLFLFSTVPGDRPSSNRSTGQTLRFCNGLSGLVPLLGQQVLPACRESKRTNLPIAGHPGISGRRLHLADRPLIYGLPLQLDRATETSLDFHSVRATKASLFAM